MADRRNISWSMPSRLDPVLFGENCDFASWAEAARLGKMDTNVVDQPSFNQRLPLVWIIEEFAHGDWRCAIFSDLTKVTQIFRGEWVFKEIHLKFFGVLAELHRLVRRQ